MAITDEMRKTLTNPTPLYVAAGTAELAARKLRELPATVERLRAEAPERLPRLKEQAQTLAMQGVGLALEYAVKARETYDELAERGKVVVETRRAGREDDAKVTVERADTARVPVTEPVTEPKTGLRTEPKVAPKTEPKSGPTAAAKPTRVTPKTTPKTAPTTPVSEPTDAAAAKPRKAAPRKKAGPTSQDS